MHIPGHLAIALLQHRFLTSAEDTSQILPPLFIASLFPDAVDKSIGYIFHWMPNGRHFSHNIFSLALLSGLVALLWGKKAGYGWLLGHLGHMLIDTDSMMPWLFPLKKYPFKPGRLRFNRTRFARELPLLGLVLIIYRIHR